jgi:hypothetical protein
MAGFTAGNTVDTVANSQRVLDGALVVLLCLLLLISVRAGHSAPGPWSLLAAASCIVLDETVDTASACNDDG